MPGTTNAHEPRIPIKNKIKYVYQDGVIKDSLYAPPLDKEGMIIATTAIAPSNNANIFVLVAFPLIVLQNDGSHLT